MTRISRTLLALALSAGFGAVSAAGSHSLDQYELPVSRAPQQLVVHYVKSNLDGSKRLVLSLFFPAPLKVEALKVEADGRYLALVSAELDAKTLSESHMRSVNGLEQGQGGKLQMALNRDGDRLVAEVAGTRMPVTPGHWPAHIYNFDLSGLNLTLPLLKNPRADFEVGIIDPDFGFLRTRFKPNAGELPGGFVDKGKATFRYLRDETLDGEINTHRFEVGGAAFGGVTGTLWVNAKDRLIERFEHALPDNPDWKSFRLNRIGSRPMDAAGWESFMAATVRRAMHLRDPE